MTRGPLVHEPAHAYPVEGVDDVFLAVHQVEQQRKRGLVATLSLQNGHTAHRQRGVDVEDAAARDTFTARALATLRRGDPPPPVPTAEQVEDAILAALDAEEAGLAGDGPDAAAEQEESAPSELLDMAPESIHRPLCLVGDQSYAVAWPFHAGGQRACIVVRADGQVFTDTALVGALPLGELGLTVRFSTDNAPDDSRSWSGAGVKRYLGGERPCPADVFGRLCAVVDAFLDFRRSLADQAVMCQLIACYIMATYLLDAFSAFGYLWVNGDKGAGKTNLLLVVTELAYLSRLVIPAGSYATLRDEADLGACLAFDEAESIMDVRRTDPDKRALFLTGYRRGATVPFKEPAGVRGWRTRHINAYCPRLFSATRLPDATLGSRTIIVPMVRSARGAKDLPGDPTNHAVWPHERRRLIDDLWALGLAHLPTLRTYSSSVTEKTALAGRDLEPWRPLLAVALWLQEAHGTEGVYTHMERLSMTYQKERTGIETDQRTRLTVKALHALVVGAAKGGEAAVAFTTAQLVDRVNALATEAELSGDGETYTDSKKLGWVLRSLRLEKTSDHTTRGWQCTRHDAESLARAYGIVRDVSQGQEHNAQNAQNAENAPDWVADDTAEGVSAGVSGISGKAGVLSETSGDALRGGLL